VDCLARVGSAFIGGAGAEGSSAAGVSKPSGPKGPIESSRLSSVVDCARLTCRLLGRVLDARGREDMLDVGDVGSSAGFEDGCSNYPSALLLSYDVVTCSYLLGWRSRRL
jgi:hypothetical protein